MNYYPIAVKLKGRRVVVAGGGRIAQRKVRSLIQAGAGVCVVSPTLTRALKMYWRQGRISWRRKLIEQRDLKRAEFVFAATDSAAVNAKVSRWSRRLDIFVNVVDCSSLSDFISPAVIRRNKLLLALYTDALEPALTCAAKHFLEERWDDFLSYRRESKIGRR